MRKVEAVIRPSRFEDVKKALEDINIQGMTVTEVSGCGKQKGRTMVYRGTPTEISLLPKIKLELVVPDDWLERVVQVIRESALTGQIGDGKIFIYAVEDAVRIRTGERGNGAI